VTGTTWSVARFRFGATFAHRRAAYISLALLIALLGGLAMGSVAAARRTQSSFPQYLASKHAPQLSGASAEYVPPYTVEGYSAATVAKIAHLPHVTSVGGVVGINAFPLAANGTIKDIVTDFGMTFIGTLNDKESYSERLTLVAGRFPQPTVGPHAFVADQAAVQKLHLHIGETVTFGVYSNAQEQLPNFGSPEVPPVSRVSTTLVGIFLQPQDIVEDDIDRSNGNIAFTPAFTAPFLRCCVDFTESDVEVSGGNAAVARVQAEILRITPPGSPPFTTLSGEIGKAERAVRPESIALGGFGMIVALAALVIAGQLIGRQLRFGLVETSTMRALGADPAMTAVDGLLGIVATIVIGAFLAVAVAVAISPLAPLGPVRPYYPTPGISFDWTVLGSGEAALIVVLVTLSVALAIRYEPSRVAARAEKGTRAGTPGLVGAVTTGLPAPAAVGVRFAVQPGRGADPVPVRSVILGSVLALVVVMSAVIFGASLNALVSQPRLYGWNWTYELAAEFGSGSIPGAQVATLLHADPDVAAWSGAYFDTPKIDGQIVPDIGQRPGAEVTAPTLQGHALQGDDQIVLGAVTLAALHKQIGQTVILTSQAGNTAVTQTLRIVGTATMPTIGEGTEVHLEMGTGAVVPESAIPAPIRDGGTAQGPPGPAAVFVRLKPGIDATAALRRLESIATATGNMTNDGVVVNPVEHPAEIVNYKTLGATPAILGGALALGAMAGLGLTLLASVRRRRRDLALLKTLGFTTRQLVAVVACQATAAVAIGAVVGIPLGIASGRYLWDLFANEIHAVPAPTVSVGPVVLIAVGALVLGNLVSLVPGVMAARTSVTTAVRGD
jgi:hypothetical protein